MAAASSGWSGGVSPGSGGFDRNLRDGACGILGDAALRRKAARCGARRDCDRRRDGGGAAPRPPRARWSASASAARLRALFLGDQRLPVGDRDLVVVGMDFRKRQEAVAVAAVIDEGRLQRRLNAGDLGEVDVTAKLFAVGAFEVEFLDAIAAQNHDPGLLRVGRVDQHFVGHRKISLGQAHGRARASLTAQAGQGPPDCGGKEGARVHAFAIAKEQGAVRQRCRHDYFATALDLDVPLLHLQHEYATRGATAAPIAAPPRFLVAFGQVTNGHIDAAR